MTQLLPFADAKPRCRLLDALERGAYGRSTS
jgi:hypothetical protein